jgi:hypothetical protein
MANAYSHPIERFREFASASRNLCHALALAEPHQNREFLSTTISALVHLQVR